MAKLTPESAWEFADAIKAIVKPQTTRRKATVQSVDKDGTIWVNLPGSSTVTPIQSTGANVSPGDTVLTELRGTSLHITENQTNPAIGENAARSIAKQETQHAEAMAKQSKTIADEAQAVANATNQHFFADTNGAHITDVTQDEWNDAVADNFSDYDPTTKPYHNQLLNSLGILLRTALNNLVSITRSAIAFYDGAGNAASNIVAQFGSTGAQIGKSTGQHVVIDQDSLDIMNGSTALATFGETASIGRKRVADSMCINLGKDSGNNSGITEITRWADSSTKHNYLRAIHDINNGNDYVVVGASSGTYPGYGQYSVALGSLSSQTSGPFGGYSIAEGKNSCASGEASHAQNLGTIAAKRSQTALGAYNEEDTSSTTTHPSGDARYGDYALIIGNGTADDARSNALAVRWDGDIDFGTSGDHRFIFENTDTSKPSITHWRISMTGYGNLRLDSSSDGGATWTNGVKYFAAENRTWPVENGGTGATNANDAHKNLGITAGSVSVEATANTYKDVSISFGKTYTSAPTVVVGFYSTSTAAAFGGLTVAVHSITTTGCKARVFNNTSSNRGPSVHWVAVGS